mgnify:CR=1 FL=1
MPSVSAGATVERDAVDGARDAVLVEEVRFEILTSSSGAVIPALTSAGRCADRGGRAARRRARLTASTTSGQREAGRENGPRRRCQVERGSSAIILPQVGISGGVPAPRKRQRRPRSGWRRRRCRSPARSAAATVAGRIWRQQDLRQPRAAGDRRLDDRAARAPTAPPSAPVAPRAGSRECRWLHDDDADAGPASSETKRDRQQDRRDRHQAVHQPHHDRARPCGR